VRVGMRHVLSMLPPLSSAVKNPESDQTRAIGPGLLVHLLLSENRT